MITRCAHARWAAVIATVAACLLPAAASAQDPAKPTPVRAAYVPVATWLPAWVALDKGIFARHGLAVTLTPIQNLSLLPGTVGRQFEFAASTPPDLIKAVAGGLDVVASAGEAIELKSNPTTQVIVRKDSGIKSVADLKGKVIAAPTLGAVIHVATLNWLKKNGVDPAFAYPDGIWSQEDGEVLVVEHYRALCRLDRKSLARMRGTLPFFTGHVLYEVRRGNEYRALLSQGVERRPFPSYTDEEVLENLVARNGAYVDRWEHITRGLPVRCLYAPPHRFGEIGELPVHVNLHDGVEGRHDQAVPLEVLVGARRLPVPGVEGCEDRAKSLRRVDDRERGGLIRRWVLGHPMLAACVEELYLVREVVVDREPLDAGPARDLGHSCACGADLLVQV